MRFYGTVGYASNDESSPGVWTESITERSYYGDVIRNTRRLAAPSMTPPETNPETSVENSISIIGDADAYENFMKMRYVLWEGSYWEVTSVEVRRPRLILSLGGIWNGNTA
jgi:hypothetical protein